MGSGSQTEQPMGGAHAAVHHHRQSGGLRDLPGLLRHNSKLEPEHLGADRNCLPGDLRRFFSRPEYVHHVDRDVNLSKRAEDALAEKHTTARVHRHNPVALRLQVARYLVGGFGLIRRGADHSDSPGFSVDTQQLLAFCGLDHRVSSSFWAILVPSDGSAACSQSYRPPAKCSTWL